MADLTSDSASLRRFHDNDAYGGPAIVLDAFLGRQAPVRAVRFENQLNRREHPD
jgi:hypothetical protein